MFYSRSFFIFFCSPPIKVDPAQKSRESCAFYQSSAVKREFSSVGTPRVNQKAGNVLSSLVFQFHFFRQQKTSLTSLTWFVGLDTANLCWKSWIRKEKGDFNFLFSFLKGLSSLWLLPCLNKEMRFIYSERRDGYRQNDWKTFRTHWKEDNYDSSNGRDAFKLWKQFVLVIR